MHYKKGKKEKNKGGKKETEAHNLRTMSLIKEIYINVGTVVKKGRKRLKLVCKATKLNTLFFNNCYALEIKIG